MNHYSKIGTAAVTLLAAGTMIGAVGAVAAQPGGPSGQTRTTLTPAITATTIKTTVTFSSMSSKLRKPAKAKLKRVAKAVPSDATSVRIKVTGWVQLGGSTANDKPLSQARAKKVAKSLKRHGLKGTWTIKGKGVAGNKRGARKATVRVTYRTVAAVPGPVPTPASTPTASVTPTLTSSPSASPSVTPTLTSSPSASPSVTPTATATTPPPIYTPPPFTPPPIYTPPPFTPPPIYTPPPFTPPPIFTPPPLYTAPSNISPPQIGLEFGELAVFSATPGQWSGHPASTLTYSWEQGIWESNDGIGACGSYVAAGTGPSISLPSVPDCVRVTETANNGFGTVSAQAVKIYLV